MGKKVELEALAECGVVKGSNLALDGGARVGDDNVIGYVTRNRNGAGTNVLGNLLCRVSIDVKNRYGGARFGKEFGRRLPDGACATGNDRNLSRQRWRCGLTELSLFERPIFHFEEFFFRERIELADAFRIAHGANDVLSDVGGDACFFHVSA